jgi:hypothetical protein
MTSEKASVLIERSGDGWQFSMDISHVPDYLVLAFGGKPTMARTESFLAMLEQYDTQFTDATTGRYYPIILDLTAIPPPSLDGLKSGRAMVAAISRKESYMVYLVTPSHRSSALFGVMLSVLPRLMPNRFAVTTRLEDAVAEIRAYRQRNR